LNPKVESKIFLNTSNESSGQLLQTKELQKQKGLLYIAFLLKIPHSEKGYIFNNLLAINKLI